jgi:hypothetical protein
MDVSTDELVDPFMLAFIDPFIDVLNDVPTSKALYSARVPRESWAETLRGFWWRTTITRTITPIMARAMTPSTASTIAHIRLAPFKATSYSVMNMVYVLS